MKKPDNPADYTVRYVRNGGLCVMLVVALTLFAIDPLLAVLVIGAYVLLTKVW